MNKSVVGGIVVLVLIIGGYFLFNNSFAYKPAKSTDSKTSAGSETINKVSIAATITYSDNGFSPALTTVKSGDVLDIYNSSSSELQMESDPHPSHTDDSDLNVGSVASEVTTNFTVTKTGTFGFHNHLNPSDTARITIE